MNSPVQKIKERLSIEEVVSSYIKLEKAGANLKAKCPFHNEKTPSFFVSPDRGSYYCFGCGASGDIFTFVEEFEGLDFKGTLKILAARAGIPLEDFNPRKEDDKEKLYRVMEAAASFFEQNLVKNTEAAAYLSLRGISGKSIKDFRIGYAINDWRELHSYLKKENFSDSDMEKAGLIKRTEKGVYDKFRGRIMFPIMDSGGRVIAFSGRIFPENGDAAKYMNSPETPIFVKNTVLYGIDKAKDSIRRNNFSILVEGQMDLILSHQAGYKNTVAASGTALSDATVSKENVVSNLGLIRRLSSNIVLSFDADRAGSKATIRAGKIALSLGMDVKVAEMPEGIDPADMISENGVEAWKETVKKSKHIIEFLLNRALKNSADDTRKAGREIRETVLPFVVALESSIEQAHFLKKISDLSGIPENALKDDMKKIEAEGKNEKAEIVEAEENSSAGDRKAYIERKLTGIILWQNSLKEKNIDADKVLKELAGIFGVTENVLLDKTKGKESDFIFEAEVFYGNETDIIKDVEEMLLNLREEFLKEKLGKKMKELRQAENSKDSELSKKILQECQLLNTQIQDIKNSRFKKIN